MLLSMVISVGASFTSVTVMVKAFSKSLTPSLTLTSISKVGLVSKSIAPFTFKLVPSIETKPLSASFVPSPATKL